MHSACRLAPPVRFVKHIIDEAAGQKRGINGGNRGNTPSLCRTNPGSLTLCGLRRGGGRNIKQYQPVNPGSSFALEQQTNNTTNRAADDNERPITERLGEPCGVIDKIVKSVAGGAAT